jgi:hypothetical protein
MHVDSKEEATVRKVNMGGSLLKELQLVVRGRSKHLNAAHDCKTCSPRTHNECQLGLPGL